MLKYDIIAIGASMGGVEAIAKILKQLPLGLPPIVITQHMPPGFIDKYAKRLDKECKINVLEGKNKEILRYNYAYLAPGGYQMGIISNGNGYALEIKNTYKVSGHCPSVDYLFESVAKEAGSKSIAVILTGMGSDGAKSLLKIKNAGGYTIGQNKETCVVYGMPMVANKMGAVVAETALELIPPLILSRFKK